MFNISSLDSKSKNKFFEYWRLQNVEKIGFAYVFLFLLNLVLLNAEHRSNFLSPGIHFHSSWSRAILNAVFRINLVSYETDSSLRMKKFILKELSFSLPVHRICNIHLKHYISKASIPNVPSSLLWRLSYNAMGITRYRIRRIFIFHILIRLIIAVFKLNKII